MEKKSTISFRENINKQQLPPTKYVPQEENSQYTSFMKRKNNMQQVSTKS